MTDSDVQLAVADDEKALVEGKQPRAWYKSKAAMGIATLTLLAGAIAPVILAEEPSWATTPSKFTSSAAHPGLLNPVVAADGTSRQRQVLRVGTFSAYAEGDFLRYVPETGELLLLSRQPSARYRDEARNFAAQTNGVAPITVDPTRGNLLGMD